MSTVTSATSSALLERIERDWRPFRGAIAALGRERLKEPTSAGWTYRSLIAHVAAWEYRTARRLRVYRESGRQIGSAGDVSLGITDVTDQDGFNARVAEEHRLVERDELLDQLDAAHGALVGEIAAMTDEQVGRDAEQTPVGPQSWVVAIAAGNSYGHYREHAAELEVSLPGLR